MLQVYVQVFEQAMIPLVVALAAGWFFRRISGAPVGPVALLGTRVMVPALLLANIPRLDTYPGLAPLVLTVSGVMLAIAWGCGVLRSRHFSIRVQWLLGAGLPNFGFLGVPFVQAVWGDEILPTALTVLALMNIPTAFVAAWSVAPHGGLLQTVRGILREPITLAVLLVFGLGLAGLSLPASIDRVADLIGQGAIPVMLVVTGMQLADLKLGQENWLDVLLASVVRLGVPGVLVICLFPVAGMDPRSLPAAAALLQLSMPVALTPLLFLAAHGKASGLLLAITLASMIGSLLSLPFWVWILQNL